MLKTMNDCIDFYKRKNEFVSAVEYTAGQTGFSTILIEKDYLCSLVLMHLYKDLEHKLTFKGGTLFAKVHSGFYRLSEDLDFSLSIPPHATRKERSNKVKAIKQMVNDITSFIGFFHIEQPLIGRNESRQYNAILHYSSNMTAATNKILIEIGLREQHLQNSQIMPAKTLLIDPFINKPIVASYDVYCFSLLEAYAEKIRAALCRDKLAIRDYYDLAYAIKNKIIKLDNINLINLVQKKIAVPGNQIKILNKEVINSLSKKIDNELIPTLSNDDKTHFCLNDIIEQLNTFVVNLGTLGEQQHAIDV